MNVKNNIIAEAAHSNLSAKKILENEAIALADANKWRVVRFISEPKYLGTSIRPYEVVHTVTMDGKNCEERDHSKPLNVSRSMQLSPDIEVVLRDIVSEFVRATPECWSEGELRLSFSSADGTDSCEHEIMNVNHANDVVVATEELMLATRLLCLRFKEMGMPLKTAFMTIRQREDGQWHFTTDFTYK